MQFLLKLFRVSIDGSVGFGIKKLFIFFGKKFKTSGLVVIKLASRNFDLSRTLFLFLIKSGPFILRGSRNHWAILRYGYSFLSSPNISDDIRSA